MIDQLVLSRVRPRSAWEHVRDNVVGDASLTVGARIITIRRARGWTQAELAARIGVHQNAVSVWEQGKNEPQAIWLYRLAQVFRTTMDGLYAGGRPWTSRPLLAITSSPRCASMATWRGRGRCRRRTRAADGLCPWHTPSEPGDVEG